MRLSIIYQDEHLVAINKPSGLLVHPSPIDKHETQFALQLLCDQLGQQVYPVHRLDKPTSGVLLFAVNPKMVSALSTIWEQVEKAYWAVVRGRVKVDWIDHPITTKPDRGDSFTQPKTQAAQTAIKWLSSITLNQGFGSQADRYPQTTFSLVEVRPKTGRRHQIRRHLKHLNHPIVGDTRYGRGEINRYFRQHYQINRLLLHCHQLCFQHPISREILTITAPLQTTDKQDFQLFLNPANRRLFLLD